jgi:hypothetical protein
MAWVFPNGKLPDGSSVADIEAVNDNFMPYVEAFNGRLNEHNLSGDLASNWTVADDYTTGTAWRVKVASTTNAGTDMLETSSGGTPDGDVYRSSGGWQTIRGLSWEGVIRGTSIYVLANLQQVTVAINSDFPGYNSGGSAQDTNSFLGSARYAVAIDGVIVGESVLGDLDDDQGAWMEHGVRLNTPAEIEALVPIVPGNHLIEIKVNIHRMAIPQAGQTCIGVGRRTWIIWELD